MATAPTSATMSTTVRKSARELKCFHIYGRETIRAMDEIFETPELQDPDLGHFALLAYRDAVRCLLLDRALRWPLEVADDYPLHRLVKRLEENRGSLYETRRPGLSQYVEDHYVFYDDVAVDDFGLRKDSESQGVTLIAPMSLDLKDKHCEENYRTFLKAAKLKAHLYPEGSFRSAEWRRGQAVLRSPLYAHVYNQMQGSWPSLLIHPYEHLKEQDLFTLNVKTSYEKMDLISGYTRGKGAIVNPPSNPDDISITDSNLFRSFIAQYNQFNSTVVPASGLDLLLAPIFNPKPTRTATLLIAHKTLIDDLYEVRYKDEILDKARKLWDLVKENEPNNDILGLEGAILAAKNILRREKNKLRDLGWEC